MYNVTTVYNMTRNILNRNLINKIIYDTFSTKQLRNFKSKLDLGSKTIKKDLSILFLAWWVAN